MNVGYFIARCFIADATSAAAASVCYTAERGNMMQLLYEAFVLIKLDVDVRLMRVFVY